MKLFAMAASGRERSVNRTLVTRAAEIAKSAGHDVDLAHFDEFAMPIYHGDLEEREGVPAGAQHLAERLAKADAFLISSPEYNFSIPGTLKNAIDWVSRLRPHPLSGLPGLLLSASPSQVGGNRGLWHLRVPLESLGASIYPGMFSLPAAHRAFDDAMEISDEGLRERLERTVRAFCTWAAAIAESRDE